MLKSLSRLPLWALYGISTVIFGLAYYVIGHRRQVIAEQLATVFPQLTPAERREIHKQYLKNFCDVLVEVVKTPAFDAAQMSERVRLVHMDLVLDQLAAGRSVMLVTSHLCNWEWLLQGVAAQLGYPIDAAYKPLKDAWAERLMLDLRSRFGARLVPAKDLLADFLKRHAVVRVLALNADQAPVSSEKRFWTVFLGQDTAFYTGAEQIARAARLPVLYLGMRRLRRGYYEAEVRPLWDGREAVPPNAITERYARACESDVLRSPADWLWSYRRWRLRKPLYGEA